MTSSHLLLPLCIDEGLVFLLALLKRPLNTFVLKKRLSLHSLAVNIVKPSPAHRVS